MKIYVTSQRDSIISHCIEIFMSFIASNAVNNNGPTNAVKDNKHCISTATIKIVEIETSSTIHGADFDRKEHLVIRAIRKLDSVKISC